jgi:hypothetical protein
MKRSMDSSGNVRASTFSLRTPSRDWPRGTSAKYWDDE